MFFGFFFRNCLFGLIWPKCTAIAMADLLLLYCLRSSLKIHIVIGQNKSSITQAMNWNAACIRQQRFVRSHQSLGRYCVSRLTHSTVMLWMSSHACLQITIMTFFTPSETIMKDVMKGNWWMMTLLLKSYSYSCCSLISINNTGESNNTLFLCHPFFSPSDTPVRIMLRHPIV